MQNTFIIFYTIYNKLLQENSVVEYGQTLKYPTLWYTCIYLQAQNK